MRCCVFLLVYVCLWEYVFVNVCIYVSVYLFFCSCYRCFTTQLYGFNSLYSLCIVYGNSSVEKSHWFCKITLYLILQTQGIPEKQKKVKCLLCYFFVVATLDLLYRWPNMKSTMTFETNSILYMPVIIVPLLDLLITLHFTVDD